MTCIVGMELPKDRVIIGGDSLVSSPWVGAPIAHPKVFRSGEFIYGYCGSLRAGQLLEHVFKVPQPPDSDDDLERYLVQDWVESLRDTLDTSGAVRMLDHGVYETDHAWFMVGIRGRLYLLENDFAIWRSQRGYQAVGSGEEFALGAVTVLKDSGLKPRQIITKALKTAAEHANTVGGPFTIIEG